MELKPNDTIKCSNAKEFNDIFRALKKEGYNVRSIGSFTIKILQPKERSYDEDVEMQS